MPSLIDPFYEVECALKQVRQQAKTKQRFPKELWASIMKLVESYSLEEVGSRLSISPAYLKRKIHSFGNSPLEFKEISIPQICPDLISIELISNCGITAKIQGPLSALSYINQLLRG